MGAPITAGAAGSEGVGALSPACHRLPTLIVLTPQFCTQLAMPMLPPPGVGLAGSVFSPAGVRMQPSCSQRAKPHPEGGGRGSL